MALVLKNATSSTSSGTSLLEAGKAFNFITQAMTSKFLNSLERDLDSNPLYIFYGQSVKWDNDNDSPPQPSNAFKNEISARANMIAAKRIDKTDTKAAFRKIVWKGNTVFDQYDPEIDQSVSPNNNFYIVQDNPALSNYGAVYKCLDNNNGSISKYRPSSYINPSVKPQILDDGYKWKYMFTIPGADLTTFKTNQSPNDDFLPISGDTIYKNVSGTIDRIDIDSPGIGYKPSLSSNGKYYSVYDTPVTPLFIEGDGDEISSGSVIINSVNGSGGIATLKGVGEGEAGIDYAGRADRYTILTDPALNRYVPIKLLEDLSDLNTSAISSLIEVNRKISYGVAKINDLGLIESPGAIKIIIGGSGYQEDSKVRIIQCSTIGFGTNYNSNDGISKIKILHSGSGYSTNSVIPISNSPGPSGFVARGVVSPLKGHGGDPRLELNSNAIFINSRITSADASGDLSQLDFPAINDFRQVGLIQGASKYGAASPGVLITSKTVTAKHIMEVTDTGGQVGTIKDSAISNDLEITGSLTRAKGKIVDIFGDGINRTIRYVQVGRTNFQPGENLLFAGVSQPIVISSVSAPEIDVYTGDILFINNNNSIARSSKQTETVNFLIRF